MPLTYLIISYSYFWHLFCVDDNTGFNFFTYNMYEQVFLIILVFGALKFYYKKTFQIYGNFCSKEEFLIFGILNKKLNGIQ